VIEPDKPPLDELAHFGVKGMKWGHRKATGSQIVSARRRLRSESSAYRKDYKKYEKSAAGSEARAKLEKNLRDRHQEYLKNPDRVIAARMTTGEKIAAAMFTSSGFGVGVTAGTIAGTAITSKVIEYKQATGAYNKASNKPVQKRIGAQTARALTVTGALMSPAILSYAGKQASARIIMKAGANRNAARAASQAPKAIGTVASKLKYAKAARGAFKITTMK